MSKVRCALSNANLVFIGCVCAALVITPEINGKDLCSLRTLYIKLLFRPDLRGSTSDTVLNPFNVLFSLPYVPLVMLIFNAFN